MQTNTNVHDHKTDNSEQCNTSAKIFGSVSDFIALSSVAMEMGADDAVKCMGPSTFCHNIQNKTLYRTIKYDIFEKSKKEDGRCGGVVRRRPLNRKVES